MKTQATIDFFTTYGPIFLSIIGAASVAAAGLPKGKPGTVWGFIRPMIDFAAANWGNAKNKE